MFSLRRIAVVLAALLMSSAAQAANVAEQAQTLIGDGRASEALQLLDSHLEKHPQDAEARFTRGLALVNLKRNKDAIQAFADLTRDYPQLPEPYNNLAVLYAAQGDYEKARDALEAALATHPSYATAHENLGDIYAALAGAAYNRALMLDGSNQVVRQKLALINQLSSNVAAPAAEIGTETTASAAAEMPAVAATAPAIPAPASMDTHSGDVAAATAAPSTPTLDADAKTAIEQTIEAWRSAWSKQDLSGYFAAYDAGFVPEGGLSVDAWKTQRRDRISSPGRISVTLSQLAVTATSESTARVTFRQAYASDNYSDTVDKVLDLKKGPAGWKITREYSR